MIEHQFNNDLQILEVIYHGEVDFSDIIDFYNYISENQQLPRDLKILTDARNATYVFNIEKAAQVITALKESLQKYDSLTYAFLHSKPKETAYSQLLAADKVHKNHFHKIFASREKALEWLKNDSSKGLFNT